MFSEDGHYWWNGVAWMPTRSPDGRSAVWNGTEWVPSSGSIGVPAVAGIAVALGFVELVWAIAGIAILVSAANQQYEAAGRVGTESITNTPLFGPVAASLLILPTIIAVSTSIALARHWWLGLFLGGWPAILVAFLAAVSPGEGRLETITAMAVVLAVIGLVSWAVHVFVWRRWRLSPDGRRWIRGRKSFPTTSVDGRWRWDGQTWQVERPAGP